MFLYRCGKECEKGRYTRTSDAHVVDRLFVLIVLNLSCLWKLTGRPRPANVLSTRQPTCVDKVLGEEYAPQPQSRRCREVKSKTGGGLGPASASARRSTPLTFTKPQDQVKGGRSRISTNVKTSPLSQNLTRSLASCTVVPYLF